jgi:hypothetical protein
MGALRASELSDLGMIGIGRIYEMYSSGEIEGDDEVALTFNPETGDPLSEPLVNIRATLALAVEKGILEADTSSQILERVRMVYYPKRSMSMMLESAREILDSTIFKDLSEFVREFSVDLKRKDATAVLQEIAKIMNNEIY